MPIQICTVSGVVRDTSGNGLINVTVKANCTRPFVHPSDGSLIADYEVTAVTDNTGTWSLDLVETESTATLTVPAVSLTVAFYYPSGSSNYERKEYTVIVPNLPTAAFDTLITGQI